MSNESSEERGSAPGQHLSAMYSAITKGKLNQTGEQAKTKKALQNAIQNGDDVVLGEIKNRLLKGENNNFTVSLLMELATSLVNVKKTEQQSKNEVIPD